MNFLNIGPGELMAIIVIAVLVIGPKRMFTLAQSIGRIARKLSAISGEFIRAAQSELAETEQATRQTIEGITGEGTDLATEMQTAEQEVGEAGEGVKVGSAASAISIQEELRSLGRETQGVLQEMSTGLTKAMTGKRDEQTVESDEDEGENTEAEA